MGYTVRCKAEYGVTGFMVRLFGRRGSIAIGALLSAGVLFSAGASQAQTTDTSTGDTLQDPLHAFCWGYSASQCIDNGTNSPVTQANPEFGFSISPGNQTGDFFIDILVPNNDPQFASGVSGTISMTATKTVPPATNWTATLFSSTAWTSGGLDSYLGISASPANPIGAYLPSTQALDSGATGFYVYQVNLGTYKLCGPSGVPCSPYLRLSTGLSADIGSYVVGFLYKVKKSVPTWIATANSGALFDTPEPATLFLVFGGLLGLGFFAGPRGRNWPDPASESDASFVTLSHLRGAPQRAVVWLSGSARCLTAG